MASSAFEAMMQLNHTFRQQDDYQQKCFEEKQEKER